MKILTIYDGTIQSKTALIYGLREVKAKSGELVVLQVFQSSLFVDYDAGPRAEEIARAEAARHLRDAETLVQEAGRQGVVVRVLSVDGDTVEEALRIASSEQVELVLTSPRYKAITKKSSVPVRLIPGTILVPVDNSDALLADLGRIVDEAKASGSKVLLLGILPVNLYSAEEKQELEQVKTGTAATMKKIKSALREQGLEVSEAIRSGYPDEEILLAAAECSASLIMLPTGGKTPSELTKAAAILLDEPARVRMPIQLLHPAPAS
jgi:nucleotide-binding universal stress UspA family protein